MAAPSLDPAPPLLRNLLIALSLVLAFALVYGLGLRLGVAVLAISPIVLLYVLAPSWAVSSAKAFDRDALRLRAAGRTAELRARFRRALGMRLFAPPMAPAERLAEVLRETGDAAGARREYQRALTAAGGSPTLSMMVGLAHSAFAAGEHGEAIAAYRRVLGVDASLPLVRLRLARALLRRDAKGDLDDARELIATIPAAAADREELALLRAYAAARAGDHAEARAALSASGSATSGSATSGSATSGSATHSDLVSEIESALRHGT